MMFDLNTSQSDKSKICEQVEHDILSLGYKIIDTDISRPWGAFWRLDENDISQFIESYFPELDSLKNSKNPLSPKFLLIAPQQRLSWQYHLRRSEWWKILQGEVGIVISESDIQPSPSQHSAGDLIRIETRMRHRIIGGKAWALMAEIWQHEDENNPSDEKEIVRIEDDFGRSS